MNKPSQPSTSASHSRRGQKMTKIKCNNSATGAVNDNLQRQIYLADNQSTPQSVLCPPISGSSGIMAFDPLTPNYSNLQALSHQQITMYNWLQQVYNQYMQQYLQR